MTVCLNFTSQEPVPQSFQGRQIVDALGMDVLTLATSRNLGFLPNLGKVGL
jgi:hypothetical protein